MLKLMILLLAFSTSVLAQMNGAPKGFDTHNGKAVFPDFVTADYDIEYDLKKNTTKVVAKIKFKMEEEGLPIFDSITTPTSLQVNGKKAKQDLTNSPDNETKYRVVQEVLPKGEHEMRIEVPMDQEYLNPLLNLKNGKANNIFHVSDGEDRGYLELFLPASFEHDQVKMNINVSFKNTKIKHKVYANGAITEKANGDFSISFPEHFTSSSLYFHALPEDDIKELRFEMKSIDGRKIPAVVYYNKANNQDATEEMLKRVVEISTQTLEEMESNFGAYPHDSFIVYNESGADEEPGSGPGMEFCGAMIIFGLSPLRHEIIHSYFGRGIMPANGNAGWLDEALTVWATDGYPESDTVEFGEYNKLQTMASMPEHHRSHHGNGYSQGADFIAYLHGKTKGQGGLFPFLKELMKKKKLKTITTEDFQKEINKFYGMNFDEDFEKYVYLNQKKAGTSGPP